MDAWPRGFAQASAASSQAAQIPGFKTPNVMARSGGSTQQNPKCKAKKERTASLASLSAMRTGYTAFPSMS